MTIDQEFLFELLSQPTAPFRELAVRRFVGQYLQRAGVPFFEDPSGNLLVGVGSKSEYLNRLKRAKEPVRFFIAHMDHPGFHGVKWLGDRALSVRWYGGSPRKFLSGANVWLATVAGQVFPGKMLRAKLAKNQSHIETAVVEVRRDEIGRGEIEASELFGGFGFRAPVWAEKDLLYTKAADDLIGVFSIVSVAIELHKKKRLENFIGLLSRAEEVGFIGAIHHFDLGWLKKFREKVICVSLETSRTLPGALVGKGPVVRLGDRATVFDCNRVHSLTQLAQGIMPGKFQRRIMDGGTCEATVAVAHGFSSIGISVPLGNYHNQCFEGGPDSRGEWGPAPEFVSLSDLKGMLALCKALVKPKVFDGDAWESKKKDFAKWKKEFRREMTL